MPTPSHVSAETVPVIAPDASKRAVDQVQKAKGFRTVALLCGLLGYQGYTLTINGVAAPWIAASFQLGESGIASLYAVISISAIGSVVLSRISDRFGRRRILLACMAATPMCALGAALSPTVAAFAAVEILLYAFIGAAVASAVVMIAETLPLDLRAKGQSFGGLGMGVGAGLCLTLMPLLAHWDLSWRWMLSLSVAGVAGVPVLVRSIPESERWQLAAARGDAARGRLTDLWAPRYRRRALAVAAQVFLNTGAATAASTWSYYHGVSVVGLSAATTSVLMLVAGAVGMAGFPLAAWACERSGRVPTVVVSSLALAAGALFFYWGPPSSLGLPELWLGAGFCVFTAAVNAGMVAAKTAATELFPTALRGAVLGWSALIGSVGALTAQTVIALLASSTGGLSIVVGALALLAIPGAAIFRLLVDETRGLSLEAAAREV